MTYAIKQKVVVQADGVIEIRMPQLPLGTHAEVIVLVEQNAADRPRLLELIDAAPGLYGGIAKVDEYLDQLRNEWSESE